MKKGHHAGKLVNRPRVLAWPAATIGSATPSQTLWPLSSRSLSPAQPHAGSARPPGMASLPRPVTKTGSSFLGQTFDELIHARAADMGALRAKVRVAGIEGYDDIALVRYLCGFGTVAHTFSAIKAAQDILRDKADVIQAAAAGQPLACASKIEQHSSAVFWTVSDERAMYIIRVADFKFKELMKSATFDDIVDYNFHMGRKIWLWVDSNSRRTGRIIKYDVILDFANTKYREWSDWSKVPPAKFRKAIDRMTASLEVCHPLVQGDNIVINMPCALLAKRLLSIFRPLLPKSMVESLICPGNRKKQPISVCPYVQRAFPAGAASLPTLIGGTCPVTGASAENLDAEDEFFDAEDESELPDETLARLAHVFGEGPLDVPVAAGKENKALN